MNTATLYNEKKKTIGPKLRFQEFNHEWTKIKLGDLLTFKNGLNSDKEKYGKGIKFINVLDILNNNFITYDKILGSVEVTEKEFEKNEVSYGDILFQRSSETRAEVGQANVYLDKDKSSVFGGFVIRGKAKYEYNPLFMNYLLRTPIARKEITDKSGGSTRYNVGQDTLSQVQLTTTIISEQQKIASFLSAIDEKIQQLSRKKELLEQYKKGIMQQLFSGKLRFKDKNGENFTDWEEKKLGTIGTFQTSSVDKLSKDSEQHVYLVNYMNVYKHEEINNKTIKKFQVVTAKENQITSCNLKKGDILFTPSSETPTDIGHSVVIFEDIKNAVYSYHLMRFRPTINIDILYSHYFCNIPEILDQLSKLATGSTRFTISVKSFSSIKVKLPCIEEQKKIANFLSSIDIKIESTSKQIAQTQTFKKGLLQQMFV